MQTVKIAKHTIEDIREAAKKTFPMEFIAMLGSKTGNHAIDEIVVIPAVFGEFHSIIYSHLIPFDRKIIGSVHSHPTQSCYPSEADLQSFRKLGKLHLIICYPFTLNRIKAFDSSGKTMRIEIME